MYDNIHKTIGKVMFRRFHKHVLTTGVLPVCCPMRRTRDFLPKLFAELNYNIGAEIGVRRGDFSKQFCILNPKLKMFCIDSWEPTSNARYTQERQDGLYASTVKQMSKYNAEVIRKRSLDAVNDFKDESLDFVYIDANHTFDAAVMDIIHWSKKVRSGGMIGVHDYYHAETGVVKAVEAYTYCHDIRPWYTTKESQPTAFWVKP